MNRKRVFAVIMVAGVLGACLSLLAGCGEEQPFAAPVLTVNGDTLSWNSAEGAVNGYTVRVGESHTLSVSESTLSLSEGAVVEYFLEGENSLSVKVNATEKKAESAYSEPVIYTYTVPVPERSAFQAPTLRLMGDVLTWNAAVGAINGYTVRIGEAAVPVTGNSLILNDYLDRLKEGDNPLAVKVNETDEYDESAYSEEVVFTYVPKAPEKLSYPRGLSVQEGVLTWGAVTGATEGYAVFVNGTRAGAVKEASYTLSEAEALLVQGDNLLTVQALATENNPASELSEEYTYFHRTPFASVTPVIEGRVVSWLAVEGAENGYTVKINGEEMEVEGTSFTFESGAYRAKLVEGNNVVSVKANETETRRESSYGGVVTYYYDVALDAEEDKFLALVSAIDLSKDSAESALNQAKTAYKTLSTAVYFRSAVQEAIDTLMALDAAYYIALVEETENVSLESGEAILRAENYYPTLLKKSAEGIPAARLTLTQNRNAFDALVADEIQSFRILVREIVIAESSRGRTIDVADSAVKTVMEIYRNYCVEVRSEKAAEDIYADLLNKEITVGKAITAEYQEYATVISALRRTIAAEESISALESAINAIRPNTLSELTRRQYATALATHAATLEAARETLVAWQEALASAQRLLKARVKEIELIGDYETVRAETTTSIESYTANYPQYILSDSAIKQSLKALTELKTGAEARIRSDCDSVYQSINSIIVRMYFNPGREELESLSALLEGIKEQVATFGSYATYYWTHGGEEGGCDGEILLSGAEDLLAGKMAALD